MLGLNRVGRLVSPIACVNGGNEAGFISFFALREAGAFSVFCLPGHLQSRSGILDSDRESDKLVALTLTALSSRVSESTVALLLHHERLVLPSI